MRLHLGPVLLEQDAAGILGGSPAGAEFGVAQHVPDRHPGGLETTEKFDPDQDRRVVVTLAG